MDAGNPDIDYRQHSSRLGGLCVFSGGQIVAIASYPDSAGVDKRSAVAAEPGGLQPILLGTRAFDGIPYLVVGDRVRFRCLLYHGHMARLANIIDEGGKVTMFGKNGGTKAE